MKPPPDLKGRPIIAGPEAPTQHLSELIEKLLSPLVTHVKSYIKDDWDFLRKFPKRLSKDCDLYSCDISSLYTSIPHDLGLAALKYWLRKLHHLIPDRFTEEFIIEASEFILKNNYFLFDGTVFLQLIGTAMGTKFAPAYACLVMAYLEETKLYPEIDKQFPPDIATFLKTFFYRYMDDGIVPFPKTANFSTFVNILQSMDPHIKFTIENAEIVSNDQGLSLQHLNFLDIMVILHPNRDIETDIYYKDTNCHEYLNFDSHHPYHIKENVPYNLAKRIIVFCSDQTTEHRRLQELKSWLLNCNYPENIIDNKFHKAKLQGPAPQKTSSDLIPFVTTNFSNYDAKNISTISRSLLHNSKDARIGEVFSGCDTVLALRQPPNLQRQLTRAAFSSSTPAVSPNSKPGLYKCLNSRCDLCNKNYIQECKEFKTCNGKLWQIKSHIDCNTNNVVYFLQCAACRKEFYTGKTNNLRKRMNVHKSSSNLGNSTNIFDNHVFKCKVQNKYFSEPQFFIYAFMSVRDERMLIPYERFLHNCGYDSMNR